ncbi:MAG: alkyl sulfatase [Betaproteobacteria bacterium]
MSVEAVSEAVTQQHRAIEVVPMAIHIGAEIRGVDLSRPLPPEHVTAVRNALLRWKVVFFRDQSLDHRRHIAAARQFGETTAGHVVYGSDGEYPQIYSVAKHRKANRFQGQTLFRPWSGWHTDITAAINPPAASILRGDIVPPYGGDTQFTSLAAAYNALSPVMQTFVDGLRGVHRFAPPAGVDETPEYRELMRKRTLVSEHPIVRVHPETGERTLFVSPSFLKSIVGLSSRESQVLLEFLWEHIVRPEFTVRFRWEPGSVAFWDNRATAHLAPRDIFDSDFDRQFYRVTLVGDVPVGVDGKSSTPIEGDPIVGLP